VSGIEKSPLEDFSEELPSGRVRCRCAVEEVLALVKERKLEQLREELGVLK